MNAPTKKKEVIRRKLVIVGDGACGKTSLLTVFTLGYFPKDYVPTVFDNLVTDIKIDGRPVQLALWDTAGQEDYERLRPLSYSKAHVILIGFAVNAPDSFESVTAKWIGEVNSLCPDVPVILVGLKKDLREDPESKRLMEESNISFIDSAQGEAVAQQIGARRYIECSALSGEKVNDVFEAATRAALLSTDESSTDCNCCVVL